MSQPSAPTSTSLSASDKMLHSKQATTKQTQQLVAAYKHISTSTIGHLTTDGYLPNIKPVFWLGSPYVGVVKTVTLTSANTTVIAQALKQAKSGDVLCIDARMLNQQACWGALRTCAAIYEKLTAVIVLGCVTDLAELKKLGFPVLALGVSSITTTNNQGEHGMVNADIHVALNNLALDSLALNRLASKSPSLSGTEANDYRTRIQSGDIAIMDDDGVFILSQSRAKKLLHDCQNKQKEDDKKFELFFNAFKNNQLDTLINRP